jgi:hypothetical protein
MTLPVTARELICKSRQVRGLLRALRFSKVAEFRLVS